MEVTTGKAKVSAEQLKNLPAAEVAKIAARAEGKPDPEPTQEEKAVSAAQARLQHLRALGGDVLIPVDIDGETLYIRRLNYQGLIELALSVTRDGYNVLNIEDEGGVISTTVAVLLNCVTNADDKPFFTYLDLWNPLYKKGFPDAEPGFLQEPTATAFITSLVRACYTHNPDILSTLKKA